MIVSDSVLQSGCTHRYQRETEADREKSRRTEKDRGSQREITQTETERERSLLVRSNHCLFMYKNLFVSYVPDFLSSITFLVYSFHH